MSQEVHGVVAVSIPEISKFLKIETVTLSHVVMNKSFERSYRARFTINRNPWKSTDPYHINRLHSIVNSGTKTWWILRSSCQLKICNTKSAYSETFYFVYFSGGHKKDRYRYLLSPWRRYIKLQGDIMCCDYRHKLLPTTCDGATIHVDPGLSSIHAIPKGFNFHWIKALSAHACSFWYHIYCCLSSIIIDDANLTSEGLQRKTYTQRLQTFLQAPNLHGFPVLSTPVIKRV